MKIYYLIILIPFFPLTICAQYVNAEGELLENRIIEELQMFGAGSAEQENKRKEILRSLAEAKKHNPILKQEKKKRDDVSIAIMQLVRKTGKFSFLNSKVLKEQTDSVNSEVLELEKKLSNFKDSVNNVYSSLRAITENEFYSRATREKAARLLGTSNNLDDIKYIFEKHTKLTFGEIEPNVPATETWGNERSAIASMSWQKIPDYPATKLERNWILFPFLIEYWGKSRWSKELENTWSEYLLEFVIFKNLTHGYEKPWLLVEFMKANASNPDTGVLEFIEDKFGQK